MIPFTMFNLPKTSIIADYCDCGYVPCKGIRSSQLVHWSRDVYNAETSPESHLCNGILDCIDTSDETSSLCEYRGEVNDGINLKVRIKLC